MGLDDFGALLQQHGQKPRSAEDSTFPIVMIVDDDTTVLGALASLLKEKYTVRAYSTAASAVAAITDDVSAVVLDVKMRHHDGFWACDEFHKRQPHLPVIFYSAYQDMKAPIDIINQHQPFGYVAKGSPIELLLDLLERAVRFYSLIIGSRETIASLKRVQASMQKLKGNRPT